jgi:hypothetical protein
MLRCLVSLCFSTAGTYIKIQSKNLDHGECTFVKVDKTVIGLMFWNFIGMFLNLFLGCLELVTKNNVI